MESKESDKAKTSSSSSSSSSDSEETDQTSPKQTSAATSMRTEKAPEGKSTGDKTSENKSSARSTVGDGKLQPSSGKSESAGKKDNPELNRILQAPPLIAASEFAAGTVTRPIAKCSKVKDVEMTDEGGREDSNVKDVEMTDEGGREDSNVKDVEMTDEGRREDSNVKDVEMTDEGRREDSNVKDVEMTDEGGREDTNVKIVEMTDEGRREDCQVKNVEMTGQREDHPSEAVKTVRVESVEMVCKGGILAVVRDLVECAQSLTMDCNRIDRGLKNLVKDLGATTATFGELGLPIVEPRPAGERVDRPAEVEKEQKAENEHAELPAGDLSTSSDEARSPLVKKPKVGTEEDL